MVGMTTLRPYRSPALPPYCTPKPPYHPRYDHAPPFSGLHSQQVSLGPSRTPYHDQDYGSRPDGNIGTVSITTRIFPFPDALPVTLTNPFPAFMSDHPPTTPPGFDPKLEYPFFFLLALSQSRFVPLALRRPSETKGQNPAC